MWRATCVVGVVCAVLAALALLAGCEEAEVVYVWPDAEVDGGTPDLGDLGDVDADAGHDAGRRAAGRVGRRQRMRHVEYRVRRAALPRVLGMQSSALALTRSACAWYRSA